MQRLGDSETRILRGCSLSEAMAVNKFVLVLAIGSLSLSLSLSLSRTSYISPEQGPGARAQSSNELGYAFQEQQQPTRF